MNRYRKTLSRMSAISVLLYVQVFGQEEQAPQPAPSANTPLASKQEMIRDRFERFQDRVFGLRDQLAESEPENAARLERALQRAGELGLADKLEEIIAMLNDPSALHKAVEEEDAWLANAQNLLDLLLAQDPDAEKRREEMERLKEYQEQVERLLKEQKELRGESGQAAAEQRMKAQLDQAIQRAGELQKRQSALSQSAKQGGQPQQGEAQKQEELGRDTDQLSKDLKAMAEPPADPSSDSQKLEQARKGAEEASKSSQGGSQSMSQAAQQMQQGGQSQAGQEQQKAEEALKETLKQLEAARKALEEEPDSAKAAEKQEGLADQTKGLAEKMQQDAAKSQSGQQGQKGQEGQQGQQGSQSQSPPGSQNLQQAQQEMNKAAGTLSKKSPAEATPKQDKAIEQLQQAKQELEKALEELRKEERAETLRDLEARIRDMLTKQKPINDQTIALDEVGKEKFKRAEHLQLAELSTQQRGLSEKAATCLHILDEDASTIAFPHIMEQLVDDMVNSAERLADFEVGAITQTVQAEIIDALEQLLEAVQKMQEENESQQGQPQQQQQGPQPLLPQSAELKLLRSSQLRINNRTGVIADQMAKGAEEKTVGAKSLVKLSARQAQCADIAREIRDQQPQ